MGVFLHVLDIIDTPHHHHVSRIRCRSHISLLVNTPLSTAGAGVPRFFEWTARGYTQGRPLTRSAHLTARYCAPGCVQVPYAGFSGVRF